MKVTVVQLLVLLWTYRFAVVVGGFNGCIPWSPQTIVWKQQQQQGGRGYQRMKRSFHRKNEPHQRALPQGQSFSLSTQGGTSQNQRTDFSKLKMMIDSTSPRGGGAIEEKDESNNTNLQALVYMMLSSLSFSLMFLGVKLYSSAPTFTLVFYRSVVQAILSLLLLKKQGQDPWGPPDVRGLLTLRGATGSLAVAALFYAVQHLPLPDAITLQFTTPVFAALLAVPMLGESWKPSDMIGAVFCLSGVLMIARPSWLFGSAATISTNNAATATLIGLTGAAFAAAAYVLVRRIGSRAHANVMVFYYAVFSAVTAPIGSKLLDGEGWNVLGKPSSHELLVFAGLGVAGFLGQLFTNMGLTLADSAATATLVTNIQIVFAFIFEITLLHESLSPWSIAGTALIVGYMAFAGVKMIDSEKKAALSKGDE